VTQKLVLSVEVATHQPSQLLVSFQTLKAAFATQVNDFPKENDGRRPVRDDMARLISAAFERHVKPSVIAKAFENTGIWPLSLEKMSVGVLASSRARPKPRPSMLFYLLHCPLEIAVD
jgi:hypothetical protein